MTYDALCGLGMAKGGRLHGGSALGAGCGRKKSHGSGEKRTKRSMAVESPGLPVRVTFSGANRQAIKLLEETWRSIVNAHLAGAKLCLDAEYVGTQKVVEGMGYEAHIRPRGGREGKESTVQSAAVGRGSIPFVDEPLQKTAGEVLRRKRGTIGLWRSSPGRLLFGEILSLSILALFPDKFLIKAVTW